MDLLSFLVSNPVMGWLACLALLLIIVSVASVLWPGKLKRKPPLRETGQTRFLGTQVDLVILIFGIILLLALARSVHDLLFA